MRYLTFALGKGRLAKQTLESFIHRNSGDVIAFRPFSGGLFSLHRQARQKDEQGK